MICALLGQNVADRDRFPGPPLGVVSLIGDKPIVGTETQLMPALHGSRPASPTYASINTSQY